MAKELKYHKWKYQLNAFSIFTLCVCVTRELKRRVEELEAELKEAEQSDVRAALVTLEGRIKQVHGAVCGWLLGCVWGSGG